jgi:hypothetical protein
MEVNLYHMITPSDRADHTLFLEEEAREKQEYLANGGPNTGSWMNRAARVRFF